MSSILDALKKLEEEKAEAAQTAPLPVEDDVAERELVRSGRRREVTLQFRPMTLVGSIAGIVAVTGLLAFAYRSFQGARQTETSPRMAAVQAVSGAVTATPAVREGGPTAAVPAKTSSPTPKPISPPNQTPVTPSVAAPNVAAPSASAAAAISREPVAPPATPVHESFRPSTPSPELSTSNADGAPAESAAKPPQPAATTPAPLTSIPPPSPIEIPAPANDEPPKRARPSHLEVVRADTPMPALPMDAPRKRAAPATPKAPPADAAPATLKDSGEQSSASASTKASPTAQTFDMYALPILTETDKLRLGLKGLEVNMLRSPNKNRPYPSAVINMQQVYINETIQGTKAKLIGVDVRGIAIDVGGERFFVRQ